jgi:transcriptional regulator with XRE-family HTH domain
MAILSGNYEDFLVQVGGRLKKLLLKDGITQTELAETLEISQPALSNIFKGKTGISSNIIFLLVKKYNIDWNYLYMGESAESVKYERNHAEELLQDREIELLSEQLRLKNEIIHLLKQKIK